MTGIKVWGWVDGDYVKSDIEGTEDFVSVVQVGEWDYSWHMLEAWFSPSRDRFFWVSGSGCSCNSLMDDVRSLGDFGDGDRDALVRAIKSEFESDLEWGSYGMSKESLKRGVRDVRTWRYVPEVAA